MTLTPSRQITCCFCALAPHCPGYCCLTPSRQITCCFCALAPHCPRVFSGRKTFTPDGGGTKWLILVDLVPWVLLFDALTPNHLLLLRSGPTLPRVFSGRKTFTPDGSGTKYNTCQTCFGAGVLKNTCPAFKKDTSGQIQQSTFKLEMSFSLWMRILHEIPGR